MKDLNNKKEYLLQYQVEEFKVVEKSGNKIWPLMKIMMEKKRIQMKILQ
jgi:hypothetical protein